MENTNQKIASTVTADSQKSAHETYDGQHGKYGDNCYPMKNANAPLKFYGQESPFNLRGGK